MDQLIADRLESIQQTLLSVYKASNELKRQTSVKGNEREIFVASFLQEMFPPHFRFGSGVIIDQQQNRTGQLDVVIELPFAPSFSLGQGSPRIYFSDTIGAVIEVKSNIFQGDGNGGIQIERQLKQRADNSSICALKDIRRSVALRKRADSEETVKENTKPSKTETWVLGESSTIPAYVVGYMGPGQQKLKDYQVQQREEWNERPEYASWFRGILQIDGPFFIGSDGSFYEGPQAIGAFINSLYFELNRVIWGHAQLAGYFSLI